MRVGSRIDDIVIALLRRAGHDAEALACVEGTSVNSLVVDALGDEIDRFRSDRDLTSGQRNSSSEIRSSWSESPGGAIHDPSSATAPSS